MFLPEIEQSTEAWLNWRNTGTTASESPILLLKEKHPYSTPKKLFDVKKGYVIIEDNYAMQRGRESEGMLRDWFNSEFKKNMLPICCQSDEFDFMLASLDGYDKRHNEILEIKWTNEKYHLQAKQRSIPEPFYIQMQHQFICSGAVKGYYLSHNAKHGDSVVVDVFPDKEMQQKILTACDKFFQCFREFEQLPFEYYTNKDQIEAPDEMQDLLLEYDLACTMLEMQKKKVEQARNKVIKAAPHTNIKGFGWTVQQISGKTTTSYKDIPEIQNIDLSKFQKTGKPSWTFKKDKVKNESN